MADPSTLLGPIDAIRPVLPFLLVGAVALNMATRALAHRRHRRQAEDGPEAVSRWIVHEATNVLLLLVAFYFATVQYHGGMVLSVLVLGLVVSDFFEFEARRVEARKEESLDRPNSALAASMLVLAYTLFQTAFFVVAPVWNAIV